MSSKSHLEQRRAMLLAECTLQRTLLVAQSRQLGLSTGLIKSGDGLPGRFKQVPAWASLLITAVATLVPGKAGSLARSAMMLMQLLRALRKHAPERESTPDPGISRPL